MSTKRHFATVGHLPPPITGENLCRLRLESVLVKENAQVNPYVRTLNPRLWFGAFDGVVIVNGCSSIGTLFDTALACWMRLRGKPVWFYFHNRSWQRYRKFPFRILLSALPGRHLWMLVLTHGIAAALTGAGHRARVLSNSGGEEFDRLAASASSAAKKRLLWMGRPEAAKGFSLAVQAFYLLKAEDPSWRFDVFGSDGAGLPQAEGISYRGFVTGEEKLRAFANGGVFILPSKEEILPLSIIEAFSAGLPVVASDVGGILEMVGRGENRAGIVLGADQQSPVHYAQAVLSCMQNYDKLSAKARYVYLTNYSHAAFVKNVRAVFNLG